MPHHDESSWSSSLLSWPGIALIAALFGVVALPSILTVAPSSSPPEGIDTAPGTSGESRFYCRPTEDPWRALGRERKRLLEQEAKYSIVAADLAAIDAPSGARSKLCVLPVIIPGDLRTAEGSESRCRARLSVIAGLGASGYIADSGSSVSLANLSDAGAGGNASLFAEVPCEWYIPNNLPRSTPPEFHAVLVLWIRDAWVFNTPTQNLSELQKRLEKVLNPTSSEPSPLTVKVIGPWWSGILADMLRPQDGDSAAVEVYSATATTADACLDRVAGVPARSEGADLSGMAPKSGRARIAEKFKAFHSLTCTDDALALDLLREMRLRGVDPLEEDTRIAIVADWSSEAGRVLPLTFAAVLKKQLLRRDPEAIHDRSVIEPHGMLTRAFLEQLHSDDPAGWPRQILRVHYLSGIEANIGNLADGGDDETKGSSAASTGRLAAERAEGPQQVDAIRRLADTLRRRIQEQDVLDRKPGRLRAIGIMGIDVYDKLTLLRALRPRFPDVLFFTTGLDARLLHPSEHAFTRNLIVASPFGFELSRPLQVGAAPFRSWQQTGVFYAVQAAMDSRKHVGAWLMQPQLFELSRSGAVPLIKPWARQEHDTKDDLVGGYPNDSYNSLHPQFGALTGQLATNWQSAASSTLRLLIGGACLVGVLALVFLGHVTPRAADAGYLLFVWLVFIALALIGVFMILYDGVEPLSFLNGVSIWPTQFVRLVAAMLVIAFLINIHRMVRTHYMKLQEDFALEVPSCCGHSGSAAKYLDYAAEMITQTRQQREDFLLRPIQADALAGPHADYEARVTKLKKIRPSYDGSVPDLRVDAETVWQFFCEDNRPFKRYVRAGLMSVLYVVGCLLLVAVLGRAGAPYRGTFSFVCDRVLVWASGLGLIFLMFVVVSVTQSGKRFIEQLSTAVPTYWRGYWARLDASPLRSLRGHEEALSYYLDISFIGRFTRATLPFIYYPFIVLTLLIVARWSYFDQWYWTPFIVVLYCANAIICLYCAILLRRQAIRAKEEALTAMNRYIAVARWNAPATASQLEIYRLEVERNQDGAFTPWSRQPIISALLIPLGSGGMLQVLNQMMSR